MEKRFLNTLLHKPLITETLMRALSAERGFKAMVARLRLRGAIKENGPQIEITEGGLRYFRDLSGLPHTLDVDTYRTMATDEIDQLYWDCPIACGVVDRRKICSAHVRLTLARMYGREVSRGPHTWQIVVCVSSGGTIGVVAAGEGTAWDSGVAVGPGAADVGLHPSAGMPGHTGLHRLEPAGVGEVAAGEIPAGWQRLAYVPADSAELDVLDYVPDHWQPPTCVCTGLLTVFGDVGRTSGRWLMRSPAGGAEWPWGVPPWIEGESASVLGMIDHGVRLPRGGELVEIRRVESARDYLTGQVLTEFLRLAKVPNTTPGLCDHTWRQEQHAFALAAELMFRGQHQPALQSADVVCATRMHRASTEGASVLLAHVRALREAWSKATAWEIARALHGAIPLPVLREMIPQWEHAGDTAPGKLFQLL